MEHKTLSMMSRKDLSFWVEEKDCFRIDLRWQYSLDGKGPFCWHSARHYYISKQCHPRVAARIMRQLKKNKRLTILEQK